MNKMLAIGVCGLRAPDGTVLESFPIYAEAERIEALGENGISKREAYGLARMGEALAEKYRAYKLNTGSAT